MTTTYRCEQTDSFWSNSVFFAVSQTCRWHESFVRTVLQKMCANFVEKVRKWGGTKMNLIVNVHRESDEKLDHVKSRRNWSSWKKFGKETHRNWYWHGYGLSFALDAIISAVIHDLIMDFLLELHQWDSNTGFPESCWTEWGGNIHDVNNEVRGQRLQFVGIGGYS